MTASGQWVTLRSARGYPYRVWRKRELMPRIPQYYLDCSIYLYDSEQSAEAGENFGGSGGLVSVHSPPVWDESSFINGRYTRTLVDFPPHVYAVTNKHVARKGFPVIRLNTIDDKHDVLELEHGDWMPHPDGDDLAVASLDMLHKRHDYFAVPTIQFLERGNIGSDVGAGDDIFMVGRFITHGGRQRNTPSIRFGSIAMLPFEKIKLGEEANYHMQEAFLVETRSISGYSGSPVFLYRPEQIEMDDHGSTGITELVGHLSLLGIDCGHVPKFDKVVRVESGSVIPHPEGWKVPSNTGMAIVIPAWRLEALINVPELVLQRQRKNREYQEKKEAEESAVMDLEKPETFSEEGYMDALKRASRKVSDK